MLYNLLVVALVEIEACCEGVSSLSVEVVLRLLVVCVCNLCQRLFKVLLYVVIDVLYVRTVVVLTECCLRFCNVRNTHLGSTCLFVLVSRREDVDENEMAICTYQQSFGTQVLLVLCQLAIWSAHLVQCFQCSVGSSY